LRIAPAPGIVHDTRVARLRNDPWPTKQPMDQADESLHQGHDKLFKLGFSTPADAAAFLRWRLAPALADSVDWEGLRLEPGSFIDSQFRSSESDLLFSAPFRGEGPGDPGCLFYFLLEHFSNLPRFPGLQVLRYMARVWESRIGESREEDPASAKLPPIVPVVVFQNRDRWDTPTRFAEQVEVPASCEAELRPFVPDFGFSLLQLAEIPYEAIAGTPAGILVLRTLKAERRGELLGDAVWDEALMANAGRELFERVLRYLMGGGVDKEAFRRRLEKVVEPEIRSAAMTLAEQFIQEGLEEGIEKGIEKGIEAGHRADVLEVLELRFGEVPAGLREALGATSGTERLRALHRGAILASTLEEFAGSL